MKPRKEITMSRLFRVSFSVMFMIIFTTVHATAEKPAKTQGQKPYRRALVLVGGGMSPGIGVGILNAAEEFGFKPDVVIATCGMAISSTVYNGFATRQERREYIQSGDFHNLFLSAQVETSSVLDLRKKFNSIDLRKNLVPDIFNNLVLRLPSRFSPDIPNLDFNRSAQGPRFVILTARSKLTPASVGHPFPKDAFTEVALTDPETAAVLRPRIEHAAPIARLFPQSRLSRNMVVESGWTMMDAARASIADPILLNPPEFNGHYYFTGAVDLAPLEIAHELADEVISMYPVSLFNDYEEKTILGTFGFNPTTRILHTVNDPSAWWIDVNDMAENSMNPGPVLLSIESGVPTDYADFRKVVGRQYEMGYSRMKEALSARAAGQPREAHLRRPINPRLLQEFTCANAYEWKTNDNKWCEKDYWPGCGRQEHANNCQPIR